MTKQKLTYYTGNFDTYTKTVKENEVIQQKKYEKEQDDIKHLKAFISSCGKLSDLLQPAVCTADLPLLLYRCYTKACFGKVPAHNLSVCVM